MKKHTLSLALSAILLLSTGLCANNTTSSADDFFKAIQGQDADQMVVVVPFESIFTTPTKEQLEKELPALQEEVAQIMKEKKDQAKLQQEFERMGLAFAQRIMQYVQPLSTQNLDTIKRLHETNVKIVFVTASFQPPMMNVLHQHLLDQHGIDTMHNALTEEEVYLRTKKDDDSTLYGIYACGIIFTDDIKKYQMAIEGTLKALKFEPKAIHLLSPAK